MRNLLSAALLLFYGFNLLYGQKVPHSEYILSFLEVDDPQDMDSEEVERLEHLIGNPLPVNLLSESELRGCGLFSQYQVAVLSDYISRHGALLSLMEMSLLDGFGESYVRRIAPFISLKTSNSKSSDFKQEIAVRGGWRWQGASDGTYGAKYRLEVGDRFTAVMASSRAAGTDSWSPSAYSASLFWKFDRLPIRVIAGDFNARFGQGMVLWNNAFTSSLTSMDAFMKKPTGITQSWSFTGTGALSGVAADFGIGKCQLSVMTALKGLKDIVASKEKLQLMPAMNLAWYGRCGHVSLTTVSYLPLGENTSGFNVKNGIDAAFCLRGVNVFGEMSYDWTDKQYASVLGTRFKTGENMDIAMQVRACHKEQYGIAAGGAYSMSQKGQISFFLDALCHYEPKDGDERHSTQLKGLLSCDLSLSGQWRLKLRFSERFRTWGLPTRTDLRSDVIYTAAPIVVTLRMNILNCDRTSCLSYVECGYTRDRMSWFLRQGIFIIDDWDDRIYVYERDAPGTFNAPAIYGRGLWTAMTASVKISTSFRIYARASLMTYPFMEKKKPGKAELKLQLQYRF